MQVWRLTDETLSLASVTPGRVERTVLHQRLEALDPQALDPNRHLHSA